MSRVKYATKTVLIVAVIASLFSFVKFQHCVNNGFIAPDNYVHACYTDIGGLYGARGMNAHEWPYSSATNSVEYPPITGLVMWATSLVTPTNSYSWYFYINALLLALLFIGTTWLLARMRPQFWYLMPLSPVIFSSLFINWDLWAVLPALGAIYLFDKARDEADPTSLYIPSAIFLGLSIATKFFPIVLLAPITLIFLKRREFGRLFGYLALTSATWLVINLPFALTTWDGWTRFFTLNTERGADWGSLSYALSQLSPTTHLPSPSTLSITLLLTLTGIASLYFYFFAPKQFLESLAVPSFAFVAIFTITSKVYSPQYVLWLTPLAILAMRSYKDRAIFWMWQGGELIYHLAIWEFLAKFSGAKFGITSFQLSLAIFLRIALTIAFAMMVYARQLTRLSAPINRPINKA